jgi:hypothetical protein
MIPVDLGYFPLIHAPPDTARAVTLLLVGYVVLGGRGQDRDAELFFTLRPSHRAPGKIG